MVAGISGINLSLSRSTPFERLVTLLGTDLYNSADKGDGKESSLVQGVTKTPGRILSSGIGLVAIVSIVKNLLTKNQVFDDSVWGLTKRWSLPVLSLFGSTVSLILSHKGESLSKLNVIDDISNKSFQKHIFGTVVSNLYNRIEKLSETDPDVALFDIREIFFWLSGYEENDPLFSKLGFKFYEDRGRVYFQTIHNKSDGLKNNLYVACDEWGKQKVYGMRLLISDEIKVNNLKTKTELRIEFISKKFNAPDSEFKTVAVIEESIIGLLKDGWFDNVPESLIDKISEHFHEDVFKPTGRGPVEIKCHKDGTPVTLRVLNKAVHS